VISKCIIFQFRKSEIIPNWSCFLNSTKKRGFHYIFKFPSFLIQQNWETFQSRSELNSFSTYFLSIYFMIFIDVFFLFVIILFLNIDQLTNYGDGTNGRKNEICGGEPTERTNELCSVWERERCRARLKNSINKYLTKLLSLSCFFFFFELLIGALHTLSALSTFVVVAVVSLVASVSVWGKVFDHDLFGVVVHLSFRYGWGG